MRAIDLNADMGEYADEEQRAIEAAVMALISSCSIACGGHAGDKETMRATARLAKRHNVSVGAHPSYPDKEGFGRRTVKIDPEALQESLQGQIRSLKRIVETESITLRHVKAHGALYNDATKDKTLARLITEAAGDAIIIGPPGSMLEMAARDAGKPFAAEGFVDRLYLASGALSPRGAPGALIDEISNRTAQAVAIARGIPFEAADGQLSLQVQTLCLHSDSPGAAETAKSVRVALENDGFAIKSFG
ncbi:5-oxoprolinase subunit PxpA [Hyphococcus sp.]|uniref:5-oxoprolinase subunit PxpA n=1 Tax=Hyphococcus sp. TaxID=2038636 RepID=UPI003CCC148B